MIQSLPSLWGATKASISRLVLVCVVLLNAGCSVHLLETPLAIPTQPLRAQSNISTSLPSIKTTPAWSKAEFLPGSDGISVSIQPVATDASPQSRAPAMTIAPTASTTPSQSSDLLYLSNENLMRWDHLTGYSGLLVKNVIDFSADSEGKLIAMLRPQKIVANGVELFDLDILDFSTKQLVPLLERIPRRYHIKISPDGRWIAHMQHETGGAVYIVPALPFMSLEHSTNIVNDAIYLGDCLSSSSLLCANMTWSPDSHALAWFDDRGIWVWDEKGGKTQLAHTTSVKISDPKGKQTEIPVQFDSLAWSTQGRFLLTSVTPSNGVSWQAILDTRTGKLVQVPDSFTRNLSTPAVSWLQDGRLVILYCDEELTPDPAFAKIWRVLPTNPELLFLEQFFSLNLRTSIPQTSNETKNIFGFSYTYHIEDDPQIISLVLTKNTSDSYLMYMNLNTGLLQMIHALPPNILGHIKELTISPDGNGLLILGAQDQLLYMTYDGTTTDLRQVLGSDAERLSWLPPAPRY